MAVAFHLGDVLTLRKPHPCGGRMWRVERLGADIGIRCLTCAHYVLVSRRRLAQSTKQHASASPGGQPPLLSP